MTIILGGARKRAYTVERSEHAQWAIVRAKRTKKSKENPIKNLCKDPLKNRYLHVDWRDEGKYVEEHVEKHVEKKPKTSDRIVAAMKADPYVTGEMLQQLLGLSRRGIEDSIARLRKRGRISREGNDNGGRWIVKEED